MTKHTIALLCVFAVACHSGDTNKAAPAPAPAPSGGPTTKPAPPDVAPTPAPPDAAAVEQPPAAVVSWEDALAVCVPGAAFDDCVAALAAAKLTLRKEDTTDHREVSFELQPPFGGISVRTYSKAAGKIVMVNVVVLEDKGKGRKDLLAWLKDQIGSTAKQTRSSIAGGAAAGCGADGWGVGWVAGQAKHPEVEIQLDSPESNSAGDDPNDIKPEDALLKRAGNGIVDLCFLLPPGPPGAGDIDAPSISPTVMKAFLASPRFHGIAKLK
jgi:hypothetical protein